MEGSLIPCVLPPNPASRPELLNVVTPLLLPTIWRVSIQFRTNIGDVPSGPPPRGRMVSLTAVRAIRPEGP